MDLPNVTAMSVRLIVTFGVQMLYPLSDEIGPCVTGMMSESMTDRNGTDRLNDYNRKWLSRGISYGGR
jgi:hypothetical protein